MLSYLPPQSNFLGIEPQFSSASAAIALQPIPYERTVSYGKGTRNGPQEILRASHYVEFYDDEFERELCFDCGIATVKPLTFNEKLPVEEELLLIERRIAAILDTHDFCVVLGGEHTVSLPVIRAHAMRHPELSVLQFDAHADLRPSYEGSRFSHACVIARIAEFIDPSSITQVGIRALCKEEIEFIKQARIHTYFAHDIRRGHTRANWMDRALEHLNANVYITFDVDVLDPAFMPATGTPEPEGLSYSECIELVRKVVASGRRIVGFDVVELAPIKQLHHPNLTVARLVYKLLNIAFARE